MSRRSYSYVEWECEMCHKKGGGDCDKMGFLMSQCGFVECEVGHEVCVAHLEEPVLSLVKKKKLFGYEDTAAISNKYANAQWGDMLLSKYCPACKAGIPSTISASGQVIMATSAEELISSLLHDVGREVDDGGINDILDRIG